MVPILKVLNDGLSSNMFGAHSHQTYLSMIVILLVSEWIEVLSKPSNAKFGSWAWQ